MTGRSAALVAALLAGATSFEGSVLRVLTAPSTVDGPLPERPVTADQTHESVIVGERYVVKWYRHPPAPHAVAQLSRLSLAGFAGMPPCHAVLTGPDGVVALVSGYLPGAVDGWEWAVTDFDTDFGARLGTLTADLHLALGGSPALADADQGALWREQAERALDGALAATPGPDGAWLATVADRIRTDLALPDTAGCALLPIHGDLHAGQVLRWPCPRTGPILGPEPDAPAGGGFAYAVTDFDGNPTAAERGALQPAARDLAQLLTSLDHVAMIVARMRAGAEPTSDPDTATPDWATTGPALARAGELRAEVLAAYQRRLAEAGRPELLDTRLLRAFEVEQECRELLYAARYLPRWRYAPIGVLRGWYR